MQHKWLEDGIRNGGTMIVSRDACRLKATMYWTHLNKQVSGQARGSLDDAIDALDQALREDAMEHIIINR